MSVHALEDVAKCTADIRAQFKSRDVIDDTGTFLSEMAVKLRCKIRQKKK